MTGIGITTATAPPAPTPAMHPTSGAFAGFTAELLVLPTGLVTTVVLARKLGPADFGAFALVVSLISWLCWLASSLLARSAVRVVSEAEDWQGVASTVLRWRLLLGATMLSLVLLLAAPIAELLGDVRMTPWFRLLAIDVLLFNIARAYREVLTARGHYREIAAMTAVRWFARMVFIVLLVMTVGGVAAAIAGSLLATIAELILARRYHRFAPYARVETRVRIWRTIGPLVLFGAATQLQARLDLFVLAAFDVSRLDVGLYGAAQHLAVAPGLLSLAFAPLTFSSLAGYRRDGLHDHAKRFGSIALRAALCLIPFIGLVAGTSGAILRVALGAPYEGAVYVLPLLFAASVCIAVATVCVSIAAADNKQPALVPIGFLVAVLSLAALLYIVPQWGALGAAVVTFLASAILCFACYALIDRDWRTASGKTFGRALLVAPFVYLTTSLLPLESPLSLALVLVGGTLFIAAALYGLGELQRSERTALSAMLTQSWRNRPRRFLRRRR